MDHTTLSTDGAAPMPIPGHIDPMPVPRPGIVDGVTPREDGRIDLVGLPKKRIAELFEAAGLDVKAAKLRAKQVYHWLYHRGVTEFDAMTDIAKTMRPWLAERFVVGRVLTLGECRGDGPLLFFKGRYHSAAPASPNASPEVVDTLLAWPRHTDWM